MPPPLPPLPPSKDKGAYVHSTDSLECGHVEQAHITAIFTSGRDGKRSYSLRRKMQCDRMKN